MDALTFWLIIGVLAFLGPSALICYCLLVLGRLNQADVSSKARYDLSKGY